MKCRPILFNGDMVRAILDGRKNVTRRPVKGIPCAISGHFYPSIGMAQFKREDGRESLPMPCPYGQSGDRLWVRETWATAGNEDGHPIDAARNLVDERDAELFFRADTAPGAYGLDTWADGRQYDGRWRPSIHMPRWASRLTLEVVSVRVERFGDVSEADARAEGFDSREAFLSAVRGIYGPGADDLWCWAVAFSRL